MNKTLTDNQAEKHRAEKDAAQAEEAKDKEHRQKGEVMECGCCFDTITILKVTHCNGEEPHFFCLDCAQSNAKNDIGNSRYELRCMDGSGCRATFSRQQKARFLDTKMIEKLERLQQQDEIRQAELQNLWTCPFCDFAAICPPIDLDREFRCHNPDCEEVCASYFPHLLWPVTSATQANDLTLLIIWLNTWAQPHDTCSFWRDDAGMSHSL